MLAAAVRITNAGGWPVWTDEGFSMYAISEPQLDRIADKLTEDFHPPLYLFTLAGWRGLVGESRIALRMLTILGGMIAAAAVYRTGRDWFGHRAALYGLLLFAALDVVVHYAQQIRQYGWLVLAVSLLSLLFLRALQRPSLARMIAYTLAVSFTLYTLYLGAVIVVVQGAVVVFLWRAAWRVKLRFFAAWLAAAVMYLPWLIGLRHIMLLLSERGLANRPNVTPTTPEAIIGLLNVMFSGQTALLIGAGALGMWAWWRARRSPHWTGQTYLMLAGWGLLALMIGVNFWFPNLTARTLVYLMPAIVLLCGYGLSLLPRQAQTLFVVAFLLVVLPVTDIVQPRLDYDVAAAVVAEGYSPGDLVVLENGWDDNAFAYEIRLAVGNPSIIRTLPWVDTRREIVPVVPQIEGELEAARRVWVVNWLQPSQVMPFFDAGGLGYQRAQFSETFVGVQYKDLYGDNDVTVALYERVQQGETPLAFGDKLALHDAIVSDTVSAGDPLHVDLWWSALDSLSLDYSVGVFLLDEGGAVVAEHNAPPGELPTTQWTPDTLIFDRHTLALPPDLLPATYQIGVKVYWYGDLEPLPANGEAMAVIGTVNIVR